jgi:hypothetical protein
MKSAIQFLIILLIVSLGSGIPANSAFTSVATNSTPLVASCSQSVTYIAALDGTATTQFKNAAANTICAMVTDGTFSKLDALYFHANTSSANALINVISPGTHNLTSHGTCTFTANVGFTGDGSSCYNDPSFVPSSAGGHVTQNSATYGVCVLSARTTASTAIAWGGNGASANLTYFYPLFTGNLAVGSINAVTGDGGATNSNTSGSWIYTRTSSTVTSLYLNSVNLGISSTTSGGLPNGSITELAYNNNGTISNFSGDQHAYWFFGGGMSAAQVASIYADLGAMLSALGVGGGCSNNFAAVPVYFATAGLDTNNCLAQSGTPPVGPCATIGKMNSLLYGPNSSININGGDTLTGCLSLTSSNVSGTSAINPITVKGYGAGRPKISTNCSGGYTAGLTIDTITGVVVNGIDIVQGGNTPATMACILLINTAGVTPSGGYTIENNTCTGGFTSQGGGVSGLTGGAIVIRGFTNGCASFSNVTLLNNTLFGSSGVTSVDQNGIILSDGCTNALGGNMNNWTAQGNLCFNLGGTNPNTGTNPGNCIILTDGSNDLMQFNLAHDNAWNCTVSPGCGVGFWYDVVDQGVIQFSEAYNIQPGFATTGTDFDCVDQDQGVTNGVYQYLFCHNNFGYGMTGFQQTNGSNTSWGPNTLRYSITENDNKRTGDLTAGLITYFGGVASGTLYIYNNVIWANQTTTPTRTGGYVTQSGWPTGGVFANNIIAMTQDSSGFFNPVACGSVAATTIAQLFRNNDYNNLSAGTQQFYTCGAGATNINFATWAAAVTGGEASTIQTAPGFVTGPPPDVACTWTPNVTSTWPPSGCAGDVALASGAQNAKSAGANLAASGWPGGSPTRDFYVPGSGPCYNIGAYGVCP